MKEKLEIEPRNAEETLLEMCNSMIEKGMVKKPKPKKEKKKKETAEQPEAEEGKADGEVRLIILLLLGMGNMFTPVRGTG
jgi:hypothetical protein